MLGRQSSDELHYARPHRRGFLNVLLNVKRRTSLLVSTRVAQAVDFIGRGDTIRTCDPLLPKVSTRKAWRGLLPCRPLQIKHLDCDRLRLTPPEIGTIRRLF